MAEASKKEASPKMKPLEAKAVDKAKATADAAFTPALSILNAKTAEPLLALIDGPALGTYDAKESVYVGRSIPVPAGKTITVPIQVAIPGSVVDYSIELTNYDIGLAIDAERDEGVTIVKVRTIHLSSPLGFLSCVCIIVVSGTAQDSQTMVLGSVWLRFLPCPHPRHRN